MNTLITICARGGSKGIPGKNIKRLSGKPLIEYTLEIAKKFKEYHPNVDIAISTDSIDILNVASGLGFEIPYIRPEKLATDEAGKVLAIYDVLKFYEDNFNLKYDFILDLDITSPLRNLSDLNEAFHIIQNNENALNIFSVNPSNRNPYFNMVEKGGDGFYHLVKKSSSDYFSRQSAPRVYDLNASFYFYKRTFFTLGLKSALTDKSLIYEMKHLCFDLDHPIDFEFLSFLISNNKIDFDWI
jgi:CMP-N,N'-diacetyllegionaminic acid synthase